jgi:pimeloyl-ACP methyl ester carboxylesterase
MRGCGCSEGDHISLGFFDRDDVACAIDRLRQRFRVTRVALWGRSMGAATAFFALERDSTICCAVCDSAFASLQNLIQELVYEFTPARGFPTSRAVSSIRSMIQTVAHFDVQDVAPVEAAANCRSPVLIIHAHGDTFIPASHGQAIFEAYGGEEKELAMVEGDHNSERPPEVKCKAIKFIARVIGANVDVVDLQARIETVTNCFKDLEHMTGADM